MSSEQKESPALMVVDVQRDFCPGGSLPAAGSDRILPALNRYLREAEALGWPVYASRDWHPPVTTHFAPFGGEWPPHCVRDTPGAAFHADLRLPPGTIIVTKGGDPQKPGYSSFDGTTPDGKALADDLRDRGITHVYVMGLTTEFCVRQTTLDAIRAGFRVTVLTDAIAGINRQAGDIERAQADMREAGARMGGAIEPTPVHG